MFTRCLGASKRRDSAFWSIEDNVANSLVLGLESPIKRVQPDVATLARMNPRLSEYQVRDVTKMLELRTVLNRNKMGYGKTVETIEYLRLSNYQTILIIVPKSIKVQWVSQILEWWPEFSGEIMIDPKPELLKKSRPLIIITNYEKIMRRVPKGKKALPITEYLKPEYRNFIWDCVVADEAHKIKNRESGRALALRAVPSKYRVALTGTPILNKPDDLFSILRWLDITYSGESYWNFVRQFCQVEETFWGNKIVGLTKNKANVEVLRMLLEEISIYNPDLKITEPKQYIPVKIEMTKAQQKLYSQLQHLLIDDLMEQNISVTNGMGQIIKMLQVSSNPELFELAGGNPKFDWILDTLEVNPEIKLVVYSRFAETVKALNRLLTSKLGDVATIYGAVDMRERELQKLKFVENPNCRVLTGTIGAMCEGLDGLQYCCNNVVFIDKDWSPELMHQAEDRVNRYGQKEVVNVFTLEASRVDAKVGKVNIRKLEDIKEVLGLENTDT